MSLAAVAEAQDKWNKGGHNYLLQVTIANDNNNPQEASENAVTELLKRKNILGTVGPYSSTVAEKIIELYQQSRMRL